MDKSKPTQRPDLFSAPQTGSSDSRRILASLENSGKASAPGAFLVRQRPSHIVAGLTLLAVLAAAVACFSYAGMEPAQHNKEFVISQRHTPMVLAPQEVERMAAAIVNEPLPAIMPGAARAARQAALARNQAPATETKAAAGKAAPSHSRERTLPPVQVWTPGSAAHASGYAHSQAPTSASTATRPRAAAHASAIAAPARLSVAAAQPDSDVTLLAALVAHTGGQAPGASTVQASRDVVERKDSDSTDALLHRCQRLGGIEASLCRARICNGQWLHEAACRAPASD